MAMELNCVEKELKTAIAKNYKDRVLTIGRVAHITEGTKPGAGRVTCQHRNRCKRGCPYGAYFSSNSSTLPMAEATGNMTLRLNSIAFEVLYYKEKKRATGVRIVDAETKEILEFKSKIVFLCASSMASTTILMQSKSDAFPNGMGNASGELGHNIIDGRLAYYLKVDTEQQKAWNKEVNAAQGENGQTPSKDAVNFSVLTSLRSRGISAFKTSEFIGGEVLAYAPVPGEQKGCVDLQEVTRGKAWSL